MGQQPRFLCPAHDDHQPSARYHLEKRVWYCDACSAGGGMYDLAERLDVELPTRAGLSMEELAEAKRLPVALLRSSRTSSLCWQKRRRSICRSVPI